MHLSLTPRRPLLQRTRFVLLVGGLALAGQGCGAVLSPGSPGSDALTADLTGPIASRQQGHRCMALKGSAVAGTPLQLFDCSGGADQQLHILAATGEIKMAGDSLCLDASGGKGNNGDALIVWPCHGGPN